MKTTSKGLNLTSTVFVVFLILKLCRIITWSWLWITCPLWIPFGISVVVILFILLGCLVSKSFRQSIYKSLNKREAIRKIESGNSFTLEDMVIAGMIK